MRGYLADKALVLPLDTFRSKSVIVYLHSVSKFIVTTSITTNDSYSG